MAGFFKNLFSGDAKILKEVESIAQKIELLADETRALSDEDLKAKTPEFKLRLEQGETLDNILVEAFAVAREAA